MPNFEFLDSTVPEPTVSLIRFQLNAVALCPVQFIAYTEDVTELFDKHNLGYIISSVC